MHNQVRSAMGTALGTVKETLANESDGSQLSVSNSSSDLAPVEKVRLMPLLVILLALLPALGLFLYFRSSNSVSITETMPDNRQGTADKTSETSPTFLVSPVPNPPIANPKPNVSKTVPLKEPITDTPITTLPKPETKTEKIAQQPDGSLTLSARDAKFRGKDVQINNYKTGPSIGNWKNTAIKVEWTFTMQKPGKFRVRAWYGCPASEIGSVFTITVNNQSLKGTTEATTGWEDYRSFNLGLIEISTAGENKLVLEVNSIRHAQAMSLQKVVLRPDQ